MAAPRYTFFATCAPGIEPVLHAEAAALKLGKVERQVGGVRFEGSMRDAWRANLWLRTAVRVLRREARFEAPSESALDAGVAGIDWKAFLTPGGTLWVDAQTKDSALDHSQFLAQRVKDGIVDQVRGDDGTRPSVDRDTADVRVHLHLFKDRATLSVDTSGHSLHRRGWRTAQGRAPLSETLAAAVVLLSDWNRRSPLIDPFCGTGTLLVEGGMIAANLAPGLTRERFGFESWRDHDEPAWQRARAEAQAAMKLPTKLRLIGSDIIQDRLDEAAHHLEIMGLGHLGTLELGDARKFQGRPGWNATVVANMPYGERIGDDVEALHEAFGARLREHSGYSTSILTGSSRLAGLLRLSRPTRHRLLNGGIDCEVVIAAIP
ncbi:Ribosomal RNA large subunit methyltransferase K/L [Planctomycetes bacterium Poly30]|uniref:Ribosomal RNA large subunit methyltransferase K/L n=1 Tax=Saltatorellus ferox TaxID=2528018 RepID=A0A518EVC5_9BACT|nr:Ribosomal RNA large subunit methyltransferase K/L [Planctomycetes bacterium Poly30]